MKQYKYKVTLAGVLLVLISLLLAVLSAKILRPAMPGEWSQLRAGMPRAELVATLHDPIEDLRDLKGFDQVTHGTTQLGSPAFWQLDITYDATGRVTCADARFVNQEHGFFNAAGIQLAHP